MQKEPRINPDLVAEFVLEAHRDLARVKEMLAENPALVNASWDWGAGDWETGLGGAAHTGQRDIALFLLSRGARVDIFAAAMLGQIEIVRAILASYPEMKDARGPHGIPLIVHAKMGGDEAAEVADYLETLQAS